LGGGAESDDDVVNDTDDDFSQLAAKNPRKLYKLAACLTPLRRTKEIDSINQQGAGRKKDSHVQKGSYAQIFASLLGEDLPTVSKTTCAAHLQTPAPLLNARQRRYKLNIADYARPQEIYGRISFLAVCGDHLALPTVPNTTSLLAPIEGASDEQKLGATMFRNLDYLFEMHTMMRFKDPVLLKMRTPGGAALAAHEWTKLSDTALDASQLERSPRNQMGEMRDWYETCYFAQQKPRHNSPTNIKAQKTVNTLLYSTAMVPLSDGYKMRLEQTGSAMNQAFGPLTAFSTHNYAALHGGCTPQAKIVLLSSS
jgi:hypothetical protein